MEVNHLTKREEVISALVAQWREKLHPGGGSRMGHLCTEDTEQHWVRIYKICIHILVLLFCSSSSRYQAVFPFSTGFFGFMYFLCVCVCVCGVVLFCFNLWLHTTLLSEPLKSTLKLLPEHLNETCCKLDLGTGHVYKNFPSDSREQQVCSPFALVCKGAANLLFHFSFLNCAILFIPSSHFQMTFSCCR